MRVAGGDGNFLFNVGPMPDDLLIDSTTVPSRTDVEGVVLNVGHVPRNAGAHNIVFVDKGSADGLERGNLLNVLTRGDFYSNKIVRII